MLAAMTPPWLTDDPQARALATALGTQYQLTGLLGRGGMGSVYSAHEPFLDRQVAIKVLPSDVAGGDARERFVREARTAARLSHPNIVPLYTFGQSGELLYYIMGFVDGESLEARLKRAGRIPSDDARRIMRELADALEYAHQLGVIHRDVKPDNVLLERSTGRAMLTDFGIARQSAVHETLTQTGLVVGTPHYMSPEQASGERSLDGRSDLYSLGIIGYRMLTGRLPFEGAGLREVLAQQISRTPDPIAQAATGVPLDLGNVVTRALAKAPAQRWASAGAMRDALAQNAEDATPEDLSDLSGTGVRMLLLSLVICEFAFLGWTFGAFRPHSWIAAAIFGGLAMGVQLVAPLMAIGALRKYGLRTLLPVWFRQPSWWKAWWPNFARPSGDAWDRLPSEIRLFRNWLNVLAWPGGLVASNAMVYLVAQLRGSADSSPTKLLAWSLGAYFGSLAIGVWPTVAFRRWVKAKHFGRRDANRFVNESTFLRAFWARSDIAAVLDPPATALEHGQFARTHEELLREVEIAERDAPAQFEELFSEAVVAARALSTSIAHCNDELLQVSRDADPQERARIDAGLAALGAPIAGEQNRKQQMRDLFKQQLELVIELESRRMQLAERRERLTEQLRTLALHLAGLRAANANATAGTDETTDRVRALIKEIDYRIEGSREVHRG